MLGTTANGIAIFMVFATGLAAGLLGQIGDALEVDGLTTASSIISWIVPFEALYQNGLYALTSDIGGATGVIVQLGPFGGASTVERGDLAMGGGVVDRRTGAGGAGVPPPRPLI